MSDAELVATFRSVYAYTRSTGPVLGRFLGALRDRRIEGVRTRSGDVLVPPAECDPRTGDPVTDDWVEVGPNGVVTSWTWVATPRPSHPRATPFAFALVLLDGASTPILHVVDAPASALRAGLRVRASWSDDRVGSIQDLRGFVPVDGVDHADHADGTVDTTVEPSEQPERVVGEPVTRIVSPTSLDYVVRAGTVTAAFLRHVMQRRLVGRRCPACACVYLPPRGACPTCGVTMTDEVEVAQQGTVNAFSIIRIPFEGQVLEPPYAAASIVLDGADVPLLHLVGGCDVDDVRVGLRVEAVWADEPAPTLASLRFFQPIAPATARTTEAAR